MGAPALVGLQPCSPSWGEAPGRVGEGTHALLASRPRGTAAFPHDCPEPLPHSHECFPGSPQGLTTGRPRAELAGRGRAVPRHVREAPPCEKQGWVHRGGAWGAGRAPSVFPTPSRVAACPAGTSLSTSAHSPPGRSSSRSLTPRTLAGPRVPGWRCGVLRARPSCAVTGPPPPASLGLAEAPSESSGWSPLLGQAPQLRAGPAAPPEVPEPT